MHKSSNVMNAYRYIIPISKATSSMLSNNSCTLLTVDDSDSIDNVCVINIDIPTICNRPTYILCTSTNNNPQLTPNQSIHPSPINKYSITKNISIKAKPIQQLFI